MHPFEFPPQLADESLVLMPLEATDFADLFALASDPLVWEQHPNPNRYKREEFTTFFEGAMASKGAYKVILRETNAVIGCTRFYDYQADLSCVNIGYTFYGRAFWGQGHNPKAKALMLHYAFQFVEQVEFHVGAVNKRSQIAMERLGALKIAERPVSYHGESEAMNFIYQLRRITTKL